MCIGVREAVARRYLGIQEVEGRGAERRWAMVCLVVRWMFHEAVRHLKRLGASSCRAAGGRVAVSFG